MTRDDLHRCLDMLRAYWPGAWNTDRIRVWADVLHDLDPDTAIAAIKAMGRDTDYPTVARLLRHVTPPRPEGVTHGDGWLHLPGTGPIPYPRTYPDELAEHVDNVVELRQIRAQLRRRRDTA